MGQENKDKVVGFISQRNLGDKNFLYMTPGIKLNSKKDNLGQVYNTPYEVMKRGIDICIVGRGIKNSDNIEETCIEYKNKCWNN